MARPWVAALYGRESFCDEVIEYERGWRDKIAAIGVIRSRRFDCALLLQNAFEAAAVAFAAGIPTRIGYNRDARKLLLTRAVPVPCKGEIPPHQRFYYLELLRRAGLIESYSDEPIRLAGAKAAALAGKDRLRTLCTSESVIGVSPGAAYGGAKRWLPDRFAESAIEVARDSGSAVLILGSEAEIAICEDVRNRVSARGNRKYKSGWQNQAGGLH